MEFTPIEQAVLFTGWLQVLEEEGVIGSRGSPRHMARNQRRQDKERVAWVNKLERAGWHRDVAQFVPKKPRGLYATRSVRQAYDEVINYLSWTNALPEGERTIIVEALTKRLKSKGG